MLTENLEIYQERWAGQPFEAGKDSSTQGLEMWTREQLCREIQSQEADKSCGADGIHIQLLKCLQDTPLIDWLLALYNTCRAQQQTPLASNQSEIYLLAKDANKRRRCGESTTNLDHLPISEGIRATLTARLSRTSLGEAPPWSGGISTYLLNTQ